MCQGRCDGGDGQASTSWPLQLQVLGQGFLCNLVEPAGLPCLPGVAAFFGDVALLFF